MSPVSSFTDLAFPDPGQPSMLADARIFVAGHRGLVGSALMRALEAGGYRNLITRTSAELDLRDAATTEVFLRKERPEFIFLAAAKVGGILANSTYPVDFLRDNLLIQANVLDGAWKFGVKRLLLLGSSCIYPKFAPQPMPESCLLTGPLEPTNEPYAIAKIAGIELCWSYNRQYGTRFVAAMPTNLYGPGDNFDLKNSHVLPALIRRAMEAKAAGAAHLEVWGTGAPRRELMHSDDLAEACLFLMNLDESSFGALLRADVPPLLNIGTGTDLTIRELAELVMQTVGFEGKLVFDTSKPDGTPQKLMETSRLSALGWQPKIKLQDGIQRTYKELLAKTATLDEAEAVQASFP